MENKLLSLKPGRPTKYTKEAPRCVIHYIKKCQEKEDFPTIEHLASELGIGTRTIYTWEEMYSDSQHTLDMLRDAQRDLLIRGRLTNKYNSRFINGIIEQRKTILRVIGLNLMICPIYQPK